MAFNFVAASSQYLGITTMPFTAYPFTIAALFNANDATQNQIIVGFGVGTGTRPVVVLYSAGAVANDPVRLQVGNNDNTVNINVDTSTGYTVNNWFAAGGVGANTSSTTASIDGVFGTTNTTTVTGSIAPNQMAIGWLWRNVAFTAPHFDGLIAEVAVWNVGLTEDETKSLAKGFKPTRVRPQSLVFYAPLVRDLQDLRGAVTITNNNTATVADHPRVY